MKQPTSNEANSSGIKFENNKEKILVTGDDVLIEYISRIINIMK